MANRWGNNENRERLSWAPKSLQMVTAAMKLKDASSWKKSYDQLPGAGAPPLAKVMRKEARHTQRQEPASGVPLEILEHLPPKPESAYFLLCALTYTSDFTGGCSPTTSLKKELTYSSS